MTQPTIVLNVHGGIVQNVFCSHSDARVLLVDWDVEECDDHPNLVEILDSENNTQRAVVGRLSAEPLSTLTDPDLTAVIRKAQEDVF